MSDGAEEEGGYDNYNRAFLQAFIARSTLTFEEAKPILAAIFTIKAGREILAEDVTEADFKNFIAAANHALGHLDLEIRSAQHQTSGARIYALVNTASDAATQLATAFTPDEMGFVKRLLDAMFDGNNTARCEVLAVPSMQAVNLHSRTAKGERVSAAAAAADEETQGSGAQGITVAQAERVLRGLVEQGWFEKSRKGFYTLSPRALMELRGWLLETYNDPESDEEGAANARPPKIKLCHACKEIVTVGQRCPKRECPARLHDICTQNFFRIQKARKCPLCKVEWTGENLVGERAAPPDQAKPRKSGAGAGRRASQKAAASPAVEDDSVQVDGDGVDEDEE